MIQKDLSILEFTTCTEILNKTLKLEKGYTQLHDQNYQGERKRPHPDNLLHGQKSDERNNKKQWNHNKKMHNQKRDSDERNLRQQQEVMCQRCGRDHLLKDCLLEKGLYF